MLNIILDTNIIIRYTKVLGLKVPQMNFIIPFNVIEELKTRAKLRGASSDKRIDLIQKASEQGSLSIINTNLPPFNQIGEKFKANNLSSTDLSILALAIDFKMKEQEVNIATQDREIVNFARANGIEVIGNSTIEGLIEDFGKQTNKSSALFKNEILTYEKNEKRTFTKGVFLGILITATVYLIFNNLYKIISTINVWGTIIAILVSGICLFIFREKQRLSYGIVEFFVGILAIIILFQPINFDISRLAINLEFFFKISAGLYIMVRGQDNIIKALKDTKIGLYLSEKYKIGV